MILFKSTPLAVAIFVKSFFTGCRKLPRLDVPKYVRARLPCWLELNFSKAAKIYEGNSESSLIIISVEKKILFVFLSFAATRWDVLLSPWKGRGSSTIQPLDACPDLLVRSDCANFDQTKKMIPSPNNNSYYCLVLVKSSATSHFSSGHFRDCVIWLIHHHFVKLLKGPKDWNNGFPLTTTAD